MTESIRVRLFKEKTQSEMESSLQYGVRSESQKLIKECKAKE